MSVKKKWKVTPDDVSSDEMRQLSSADVIALPILMFYKRLFLFFWNVSVPNFYTLNSLYLAMGLHYVEFSVSFSVTLQDTWLKTYPT